MQRCLRSFSTPKYFRPAQPLDFDSDGRLLLYSTPSATVHPTQTFLKFYAPINLGFILFHGYLTITEYMNPLIPGKSGYLIMSTSLLGIGICIAASVEHLFQEICEEYLPAGQWQAFIIHFPQCFHSQTYVGCSRRPKVRHCPVQWI